MDESWTSLREPVGEAARGARNARRTPVLYDLHPRADRLYEDVCAGLSTLPRRLPPKYFYDDAGALLFERITRLDAYYPTRTELSILHACLGEVAGVLGPQTRVVELGSGSGLKTLLLLRHLQAPASYLPVDISRTQLQQFAESLAARFPGLEVLPVCADYTREWSLPHTARPFTQTVAFFPGSTIGNFEPGDAASFLVRVRRLVGPGGALLIGADLHKDRETLEHAYNDPEGVTAAFNLNLLRRINRECGADFDMEAFRHHAFYDAPCRRIEMRLVATRPSVVTLPARARALPWAFRFAAGDYITTEYSHKYTLAAFRALATGAGWTPERIWTDDRKWFSVWLLRARS